MTIDIYINTYSVIISRTSIELPLVLLIISISLSFSDNFRSSGSSEPKRKQ